MNMIKKIEKYFAADIFCRMFVAQTKQVDFFIVKV